MPPGTPKPSLKSLLERSEGVSGLNIQPDKITEEEYALLKWWRACGLLEFRFGGSTQRWKRCKPHRKGFGPTGIMFDYRFKRDE